MERAHAIAGSRPLWITEFQSPEGSPEEKATFLREAMAWMDQQSYIERYAYFMVREGLLVNGGQLSDIGKVYVGEA